MNKKVFFKCFPTHKTIIICVFVERFGKEFEEFCRRNNQKPSDSLWLSWLPHAEQLITVKRQKPRRDRRIVGSGAAGAGDEEEKKSDELPQQNPIRRRGRRKGKKVLNVDKIPNKYLGRLDNWDCPSLLIYFVFYFVFVFKNP